jgi:hypothetical protein
MSKPYDICDMDDEMSMIFITIGDYVIIANLHPFDGEYMATIYPNGKGDKKAWFGEASPALAIKRCKKWIAENQSEVQA